MKYINLQHSGYIIFGEHLTHSDMANRFPMEKIISAGFVKVYGDNVDVGAYGESTTLNVKSDVKNDSQLIQNRLVAY